MVKLRIRGKFVGILLITAVLPLCLAILVIEFLGFRYYKRERGRLFQSTATHLASTINLAVSEQIARLQDWESWAVPAAVLAERQAANEPLSPAA